ncbi:uncharacterized protein LOC143861542 [Tasmannia lanceolata]|uniref:uncharacterized protein LOC143861542 n=1 Tax=Tasmannia lanceolata TaxID=3420 RepID=UPI0040640E57
MGHRRGDSTVHDYYKQFVSYCHQLDALMPLTMATRKRDQLRVVHFLEGLGPESASRPPTAGLVQPGSSPASFLSSSNSWIIDSGASDHMTGTQSSLHDFHHVVSRSITLAADGSTSPITGVDSCSPSPSITLSSDLSTRRTIGSGREVDGLYRLDCTPSHPILHGSVDAYQWHCCLGHPSMERLRRIPFVSSSAVRSFQYEACELGKHHRVPFPSRTGPARTTSLFGFRYFVVFIDDYSRIPLFARHSSSVLIPQQNGVVERKLRSLLDGARTLLFQMQVPKTYWADAVLTARYLANRLPSSVLGGTSPFSILRPTSDPFPLTPRVFGCLCSVHADVTFFETPSFFYPSISLDPSPSTLQEDSSHLPALPLPVLPDPIPVSTPPVSSSSPTIDSTVMPTSTPCAAPLPPPLKQYQRRAKSAAHSAPPEPSSSQPEIPTSEVHSDSLIASRTRSRSIAHPIFSFVSYDFLTPVFRSFVSSLSSISLPKTLQEALDHQGWRAAMDLEMQALQCAVDHSVFSFQSQAGCVLLIVYVDDIIITGSDTGGIQRLKSFLQTEFSTKDLGRLRYFLGIEVAYSTRGIYLSQRKYVLDLLDEIVSVVSQHMSSPRTLHWAAVLQILRYLKSSPGKGLLFQRHGHQRIEGYTEADWAGSPADRRSTTGYCTFIGDNLVSWRSNKQDVVSKSSAEAEYRAMSRTSGELMWHVPYFQRLDFLLLQLSYTINRSISRHVHEASK